MIKLKIRIESDAEIAKEFANFPKDLASEIPNAARQIIDESTPSGRLYKRRIFTGRRTKALENLGLRTRGKTRIEVGRRFHRASAKGQPPAKDSGKFYRNIRVSGSSVLFDTPYAEHVENMRPFLDKAIIRAIETITK